MKYYCAVLDDYQNVALTSADWTVLSPQIEVKVFDSHFQTENDLINAVYHHEIIVIMRERTPFKRSLFQRLPNLKLLITSGPRNAAIDLNAATEHGVMVCGTAGMKEPPMELAWGLILSLARNIPQENTAFRIKGRWQSTLGINLHGKQLGLLGLGKIGSLMVPVAKAFGMKVMAWSQNLTQEQTKLLDVTLANSKDELLESSDFVSIHLVLSERTHYLLRIDDLKRMPTTSYLINTSRAQIVDPTALVEALQNGWIAGAGLDVFDPEPLPNDNILRSLTNVIATPHLGYVTHENYQIYFGEAVDDIRAFLNGTPKRVLNPDVTPKLTV